MKCTLVIHYQSLSFKTDVETSSVEIQRYQFFCTFQDSLNAELWRVALPSLPTFQVTSWWYPVLSVKSFMGNDFTHIFAENEYFPVLLVALVLSTERRQLCTKEVHQCLALGYFAPTVHVPCCWSGNWTWPGRLDTGVEQSLQLVMFLSGTKEAPKNFW